jgi:hypothetical protein
MIDLGDSQVQNLVEEGGKPHRTLPSVAATQDEKGFLELNATSYSGFSLSVSLFVMSFRAAWRGPLFSYAPPNCINVAQKLCDGRLEERRLGPQVASCILIVLPIRMRDRECYRQLLETSCSEPRKVKLPATNEKAVAIGRGLKK